MDEVAEIRCSGEDHLYIRAQFGMHCQKVCPATHPCLVFESFVLPFRVFGHGVVALQNLPAHHIEVSSLSLR